MVEMMSGPTIKDVAKEAQVSVATVSRVLNGLSGFSADTEKKVREAIRTLGYQYNAVARNLKTKKTNTIAILLPHVETTFYMKILNGIEDASQKRGYSVLVCHVGVSGSRTHQYMKILMQQQVDGIIGCSLPPKEKIDTLLANCGIPCVLVSTLSPQYPIPYVRVDDREASRAATSYLIRKGHRRIAMLAGSKDDVVAGKLRLEGYLQALKEHHLPVRKEWIKYTRFSYETGLSAARELMREKGFTAIVACCDEVAIAAITAAYETGHTVPDDFSIIGYDNTRTAEMAIPPLTTVSQPLYEMGERAFEMLVRGMEGGARVEPEIVPFKIVERRSVRQT